MIDAYDAPWQEVAEINGWTIIGEKDVKLPRAYAVDKTLLTPCMEKGMRLTLVPTDSGQTMAVYTGDTLSGFVGCATVEKTSELLTLAARVGSMRGFDLE